ncbi:Mediator of RNA polymerase II transcription subunit 7 [Lignoscripta atroalba]|nr:Mediator of RNA polymerase II transcription subunit 7 [Lignoscripta atroalba]
MADQQQSGAVSAAFPAPPPFYKYFTEQNLEQLKELQDKYQSETGVGADNRSHNQSTRLVDLPPELRYLVPPPLPPTGKYRSFGEEHDINASLTSLPEDTAQLYPNPPKPQHLLKITRSLLLNFLEMVHILATNPKDYPTKWEDLRDLFRNAHQLVNEYRPHQARESLILMMEDQVKRCREEIRGVKEMKRKVEAILEGLGDESLGSIEDSRDQRERTMGEMEEKQREEEKTVWEILAQQLG